MLTTKTTSSVPKFWPDQSRVRGCGKVSWVRLRCKLALLDARYFLQSRFLNAWCIWCGAFHSFVGHIRTQSPREMPSVYLGPTLLSSPDGSRRLAPRTIARELYIEKLKATYAWADIQDLRIFLMGYDAGEQWTLYSVDSGIERPESLHSWVAPKEHEVSIPERVTQYLKQATILPASKCDLSDPLPSQELPEASGARGTDCTSTYKA